METETRNFETFAAAYRAALSREVAAHPDEYGWPASDAPIVAEKMLRAIKAGSFNKDSRAIKAVCKELGIPFTYSGIRAFIN